MRYLVPGPPPCPEVVAVFYIRPAEVPTLFSVEEDAQVEQQNTVVGFLTDVQAKLTSEQAPACAAKFAAMRDIPYHEAVSVLNWAALATRPDISFAVSTVAHFAPNPGPAH